MQNTAQETLSISTAFRFRNPSNGYVESISRPFLWCLLFGCCYLAYKGAWMAAVLAFILAVMTAGISWLLFPFFAHQLIIKSYLQRGWQPVGDNSVQATPSTTPIFDFRNPANGHVETISQPFLWCLFFGCFYLAYKGAWMAASFALVLAFVTGGLSWLICPFFARKLVRKSYLDRGWVEVGVD